MATVFISHAWRYRFCDLLDAVEAFIRSQPSPRETYVWLDLFANDQHNAPSLPQLWWRQTFRCAIETIGHTCVVLSPWEDPIPLKRAWCLWEVLCTINGNVPLTVQLPPKELASFEEALKTGQVHAELLEDVGGAAHSPLQPTFAVVQVRRTDDPGRELRSSQG